MSMVLGYFPTLLTPSKTDPLVARSLAASINICVYFFLEIKEIKLVRTIV